MVPEREKKNENETHRRNILRIRFVRPRDLGRRQGRRPIPAVAQRTNALNAMGHWKAGIKKSPVTMSQHIGYERRRTMHTRCKILRVLDT
jgi:hypothetical protein